MKKITFEKFLKEFLGNHKEKLQEEIPIIPAGIPSKDSQEWEEKHSKFFFENSC